MRKIHVLAMLLTLAVLCGSVLGQIPVTALKNGTNTYFLQSGSSNPAWFNLFGTANTWTAAQKITVNSTTALFVEQDGVKDNTLIVDTTNGRVSINEASPTGQLEVESDNASKIPLIVRGANAASANLITAEAYDGTDKLTLTPAGVLTLCYNGSNYTTLNTESSGNLSVKPTSGVSYLATDTKNNYLYVMNYTRTGTYLAVHGSKIQFVENSIETIGLTGQDGRISINEASPVGQLEVESADAARIPLIVRGANAASANLITAEAYDGTDKLTLTPAGVLTLYYDGSKYASINTDSVGQLQVNPTSGVNYFATETKDNSLYVMNYTRSGAYALIAGSEVSITDNSVKTISLVGSSGAITGVTLNLTGDSNQIVLDSDGTYRTTITGSASGSSKIITTPNATGTVTLGTGTANQVTYWTGTNTVTGLAVGSEGQILRQGATTPAWTTATYPATTTINQLLYSSSANVVAGLATATNGILVTNGSGVPSIGTSVAATLTFTSLNLTADSNQIVLNSDGTYTTTITDSTTGSSKTITLPNATTTLAGLGLAQTFTAAQTMSAVLNLRQTSTGNVIAITSTDAGAVGALMEFYHQSASPADEDVVGQISFYGDDDGATKTQYAAIQGIARDVTVAGSPSNLDGRLTLSVNRFGTLTSFMTLYSSSGAAPSIEVSTGDYGNDINGPTLIIGRNSNATNANAGTIGFVEYDNSQTDWVWADASGYLRISSMYPSGGTSDTSGFVVGTQTSWSHLKSDIHATLMTDYDTALKAVVDTPLYRYKMKDAGDHDRDYLGYVIYDKDRGAWFSAHDVGQSIPALNERNLFGYHAAAIKVLEARIRMLESIIYARPAWIKAVECADRASNRNQLGNSIN